MVIINVLTIYFSVGSPGFSDFKSKIVICFLTLNDILTGVLSNPC